MITLIGMSRGPVRVEKMVGELFDVTRNRALMVDHVFGLAGAPGQPLAADLCIARGIHVASPARSGVWCVSSGAHHACNGDID